MSRPLAQDLSKNHDEQFLPPRKPIKNLAIFAVLAVKELYRQAREVRQENQLKT